MSMDWRKLVEEKLFSPDKCLACTLGKLCGLTGKPSGLATVTEGQGEHAVFIYSVSQTSPANPDYINLENALPIDSSFQFNIVSQSTGPDQVLPVRFISGSKNIVLELQQSSELQTLFKELKNAKQVQSQNAGFGLPSSFSWIEKYTGIPSTPVNPFTSDPFDPFSILTSNKTSIQAAPENLGTDWQHSLLTQADVGDQCPVVQDNTVNQLAQSQSELDFQSNVREDFFTTVSKNTKLQETNSSSSNNLNADQLGDNKMTEMLQKGKGHSNDGSREKIIRLVMSTRQEEYTEIKPFRIFCGTWNTNGQAASQPVNDWLSPPEDQPPDIYAIGFQELDLSKNAYIFSESAKESEWFNRVKAGLHPKAKYKKVKLIRLIGMMLVVFVREEICPHIYNLEAETVGTGLMGMMGNKGGVAVRFEFHDTSICFINSHLAAHTEEYERRNQDFREINNRMCFVVKSSMNSLMISDHDMVFWVGDLNYRLSDIDYHRCKKMIASNQLHELMNYDQLPTLHKICTGSRVYSTECIIHTVLCRIIKPIQLGDTNYHFRIPTNYFVAEISVDAGKLNRQMSLKKVFLDYLEGRITFIPTYKYDPGTDTFDTSEKQRAPAWCDRILWRGHNVAQKVYRSHQSLKVSDHKPVSALFEVGIKIINKERYRETYKDVMQTLDRMENEFLPQVTLDITEIIFENVKFVEPQTRNITVTNTGQVPVEFEFIKKLDEDHYCKPWLNVEPFKSVINIGDSCTIQFEVYVNPSTAPQLNSGNDRIEDILVLHLEGGKDLFVSVSGNYLPSCFGSSLEALVYMFKPIRDVETAVLIDLEHSTPTSTSPVTTDRPLDVPKELWRLIDHLNIYGKEYEDLFQQPGLHTELQLVRDCLDTGTPSSLPGTVHSVAEALLLFLESLSEPVIPYRFYYKCLDCCSNYDFSRKVLAEIPVSHRNVFKYMCAFCRHLLKFSSSNNLDAKFLSTLFGNLLLRRPLKDNRSTDGSKRKLEEQKKIAFVYNFLANLYDE